MLQVARNMVQHDWWNWWKVDKACVTPRQPRGKCFIHLRPQSFYSQCIRRRHIPIDFAHEENQLRPSAGEMKPFSMPGFLGRDRGLNRLYECCQAARLLFARIW